MARSYEKIPIVDTARRCGLVLDLRTLKRDEVEASCPFCGDHGPGKHHLSLNTSKDLYRCNLCGASGNSVTLYARLHDMSNREAFLALTEGSRLYPLPIQPETFSDREPKPLEARHTIYTEMLSHLVLFDRHRDNLLKWGLSDERIASNGYKSMPETSNARELLAQLLGSRHDLSGIPGFYTRNGKWTLAGSHGFLIPVRNKDGLIQGLKIRLDDSAKPNRKYRWLSSRDSRFQNGTRSYSWIHVTGDRTSKRAFLTEGPLKGDVASFLSQDSLFVCVGGANATKGLRDVISSLGVTEVVEVMDMDQMTNPQVRNAIISMRSEVQKIPGIKYRKYTWDPMYKGVDDYLLDKILL